MWGFIKSKLLVMLVLLQVAVMAFAGYVPEYDASTLVTAVQGEATNAFTSLFPALVAITALVVGWKYIRRVGRGI